MERPRLEIVRFANGNVEFYIDGKCVEGIAPRDGIENAICAAAAVAGALGADVVGEVDEPMPQRYRYFVVYQGEHGHVGNAFHTTPTPIEGASGIMRLTEEIMKAKPTYGRVVVTNFICTDGPS